MLITVCSKIRVISVIRGQEKRQLMFNFLFVFSVFFDVAIKYERRKP